MKNSIRKLFLYAILGLVVAGTGCRKDVEMFVPYENTVGEIIKTVSNSVPDPATVTSFKMAGNAVSGSVLVASGGSRLFLTDVDFLFTDQSGAALLLSASQEVEIEITEAFSSGDLIGFQINTAFGGQVLENGRVVKVRVLVDGKEVKLKQGEYLKIQIPVNSDTDLENGMKIFYGAENPQSAVNDWYSKDEGVDFAQWPSNGGGNVFGYELRCTNLGWVGPEKTVSGDKTKLCANLGTDFNGQNTVVYCVLPDLRSVLTMENLSSAGEFCLPELPIGFDAKLVAVSKIGNVWKLASQDFVVASDVQLSLSPTEVSEAALVDFLKNL